MRKKHVFVLLVSSIGLSSFLASFLPIKYEAVCADYSPYTYIGKTFKYEHVNSLTKVYCLGDYLQYAIDAGREIYTELYNGSLMNQNDPYIFEEFMIDASLEINVNYGVGILSQPLVRYYYYANPYLPKIVGCHNMYNDPASLVFALEVLEEEAEYLEIDDIKNAVLSYVRCINESYSDEEWEKVAGSFEGDLINSFSSFAVGGVEVNEFFASFIPESIYNEDYGTCRTNYLNYNLPLIDCYGRESDLIHTFASIDGIFEGTVDSYVFPLSYVNDEYTIRFLASWAGDLQTAAVYIDNNNLSDYSFEDILENPNSTFDYLDFYADVNAINIAGGLDLDDVTSISSIINNYFIVTLAGNPYFPRIGHFMDVVCSMYGNNSSTFKEIIYLYLGLDSNGNNLISLPLSRLNLDYCVRYHFLGLTPIYESQCNVVDVQCRYLLANEFWYYCNMHCNFYNN